MLNESPVPGNKAQQPCCAKLVYRALQFLMQAKPPSCRQYTVGARIGSLGKGSWRPRRRGGQGKARGRPWAPWALGSLGPLRGHPNFEVPWSSWSWPSWLFLRSLPSPTPASCPNDLHQAVVHKAASSVPPAVVLLTPGRKHEEWKTTFTC